MGTKIHTNSFLREYHPVIDLNASASNAMGPSSCNDNGMLQNGENPRSVSCRHDIEKVRQTILEHESIFRNQLRELHRLYGRQRELMNEIKRRGVEEEKFRLSYLLSPFPTENTKRLWNSSCNSVSRGGSYKLGFQADLYSKFPIVESTSEKRNCDGDDILSLSAVRTPQHGSDALAFSLCNRSSSLGDTSITNQTNGVPYANSQFNLNFVMKDFFHDSLDRTNNEGSLSIWGLKNKRSGNEHIYDEYAERKRIAKQSSSVDLISGKSAAFPQSLFAKSRKEFPNSSLDIGTSLSRKKKKIFGVEISDGNDDAFGSTSNLSSNLDQRARPHEQNHRVPISLIADSFVQNVSLHGANQNHGEIERCDASMAAELVMKKDPEHSQKLQDVMTRHHGLEDCESNRENTKGSSLPWFLRDSQLSSDLKNRAKSSYFMNLDSLQSCSRKFFAKVEMPNGTLHDSKLNKEVDGVMNEVNCSSICDDFAQRVEIDKGLNLRCCIDLNLSLDKEDVPSAPTLPSAIVKIATTEIDLEASVCIESDEDAPNSRKSDMSPPYEDCDKFAAEAMISISSYDVEKLVDDSFATMKWFAEVISSQHRDAAVGAVEQEFIPTDIDDFELMTLKLEDSKEEHRLYEPFVSKALSEDDALTKRNRRGLSRRGRQRRDFQRDILPSLVALSRHQVTEDFQAFEELLKAGGDAWESGHLHRGPMRNGRGRKRLGGANTSPSVKTPCSTQAEQPVCQSKERSLAGWGKKTRRLPRQRCSNVLLSFPVKC